MGINLELAVVDSLPTFEKAGSYASVDPGTEIEHAKARRASAASLELQNDKEFAG